MGTSYVWGDAVVVDESGETRNDKSAFVACFFGRRGTTTNAREKWQNRSKSSSTQFSAGQYVLLGRVASFWHKINIDDVLACGL